MQTVAVVMDGPGQAALRRVTLTEPGPEDVVVDIQWTSISAGTERLLWSGRMPNFPGMGYPLVPGYESVGRVIDAGSESGLRGGEFVFVPGARCFTEVRGLFGGAAARLVVPGARVSAINSDLGENGALLSLAATAYHAPAAPIALPPPASVRCRRGGKCLPILPCPIISISGHIPFRTEPSCPVAATRC